MKTLKLAFIALAQVALLHCGGSDASVVDDAETGDDAEIKKAPDGSHALLVGKWESTTRTVPKKGSLPFETNIRSLEFKTERDDSSTYTRYRLMLVIRPDCSTCTDEKFPEGTYRSIAADPHDLTKGKLYTTEGGNTSSRDFYEISGDTLRLKTPGLGADNRTVIREFRRVR